MKDHAQLPASVNRETLPQCRFRDLTWHPAVTLDGADPNLEVPIKEAIEDQGLGCHPDVEAALRVGAQERKELAWLPLKGPDLLSRKPLNLFHRSFTVVTEAGADLVSQDPGHILGGPHRPATVVVLHPAYEADVLVKSVQ